MLSKRGVARDLKTSPYILELVYNNDDKISFVFSSKINYNKFINKYINNRINISDSLSNRFKISISFDILSDLCLYRKIEHRGFYIIYNDEVIEWLNNIKLDGLLRILQN